MTLQDMSTSTPDYCEPWTIQEGHLSTSLFDGKGAYFADIHELVGEDSSVAWAKAERIIACVNACAGVADPEKEIATMREAIREANAALGGCLKYILKLPLSGSDSECETMDDAHDALRKLQPFIK